MSDLVRRGRVRGLGATLITQRPATLNKDILTQAEVLIALRMTGPRDVQAIDEWVRLHADEGEAREVKASLASLPVGTAWVWSPGWLELLRRVQVRQPRTFDSSSTPRPGQRRPAPRRMAPVDLAALGEQIMATMERAKAEDPRELRRMIVDLQRQLLNRPDPTPEIREIAVISQQTLDELRSVMDSWEAATAHLHQVLTTIDNGLVASIAPARTEPQPTLKTTRVTPAAEPPNVVVETAVTSEAAANDGPLPKAQRAVLSVLAQHGRRSTTQVAVLTGYSSKSGGFRNTLSALRTAGMISGRGDVEVTPAGLHALGPYEPLPSGRDLVEWWKREQLGKAERAILDVLVGAWPGAVTIEAIAAATGYSATSGGFRNSLSRLRSLQLAGGRGELTVSDTLMSNS